MNKKQRGRERKIKVRIDRSRERETDREILIDLVSERGRERLGRGIK